jgi:AraC-like DNA-binding protein
MLAPQFDQELNLRKDQETFPERVGATIQRNLAGRRPKILLELNETAYLLGYEDSNSFVRAFRTWEGVPPAHWHGAQRIGIVSP